MPLQPCSNAHISTQFSFWHIPYIAWRLIADFSCDEISLLVIQSCWYNICILGSFHINYLSENTEIINITPSQAIVEDLERFCEEFGSGRSEDKDEDDDIENSKLKTSGKPADFQALFGRGDDNNDHFMIGIKYTNR